MVDNNRPPESASRGLSDVQLSALVVQGLFGKYTHKIPLPTSPGDDSLPSVLILYGLNGVGKTTILRMLDGLIRLDFDVFREVPFESCHLDFTTGERLLVQSKRAGLVVTFGPHEVVLDPTPGNKGAKQPKDESLVESFRKAFFSSIENISFNFVDTDRARMSQDGDQEQKIFVDSFNRIVRQRSPARRQELRNPRPLADRVREFIQEAQLDSQRFFDSGEPDLFSRIIEDLSKVGESVESIDVTRETFQRVHEQDEEHRRLGLRPDRWDYKRLMGLIERPALLTDTHSRAVLSTYADFLNSRSQARELIAERLKTFEHVMSEMFVDKAVTVDARRGLRIMSGKFELAESQLSSGEYQLLYLMVAALTTHRKGTVLAIDEPELSMHPSWQRKLVSSLVKCASRAAPQIILATHSPDVSMDYSDSMVELTRSIA